MPFPLARKLTPVVHAVLRPLERSRSQAAPLASIRNFVLLPHFAALGPSILLTALVRSLRATLPDARFAVGASAMGLEVFKLVDGLKHLAEIPDPRTNLTGCIKALRAQNFFGGEPWVALLNMGSSRTEFRLAALFGGAAATVDFAGSPAVPTSRIYDRLRSRVSNDSQLIEALGHGPAFFDQLRKEPELWEPEISVRTADKVSVHRLLQAEGIDVDKPYAVVVTQSTPSPVRSWRPEYFRQMATWLHQQQGLQIVFTGANADRPGVARVRDPLPFPSADLSGKTTLGELAAVLQGARLALTLDTGAMHVGRAVKLPMVVIGPAAESPVEWLPLGHPRMPTLLSAHREGDSPFEVPGEVKPEAVQAKLAEVLDRFPNGAEATHA